MVSTLLLADHEGLYEASRMGRALLVGAILAAITIFAYRRIRPDGRPWESAAGILALVALGAAAVTIGLGLIPRETSSGYIICGPPLNLPNSIPAVTNAGVDWSDSVHCNAVMEAPMWWLVAGIAATVGSFAAAHLLGSRTPTGSPTRSKL